MSVEPEFVARKVRVIEDDSALRRLVAEMLSAIDLECDCAMTKPFAPELLISVVRAAVDDFRARRAARGNRAA